MPGADRSPAARRVWPFYSEDAVARVTARIRQGELSAAGVDSDIARCEDAVRQVLAPDRAVFLCGSGTAALGSAYYALGLDEGSEVLVPTHTFRATVTPLARLGLRPVLCDTDRRTGNIDLDDAAARITPRTAALVVTHVWGRPVDLPAARAFADRHGLALVEDCSHAHGTAWLHRPVGWAADIAVFSLGTTKMVTGGTLGTVVTREGRLFERAMLWGQPKNVVLSRVRDEQIRATALTGLGNNLRPTPVAAILAADHLGRLARTVEVKNANLALLTSLLATSLPELEPLGVAAGRTAGTLYKFHCRWTGDPALFPDVVRDLRTAGLRVRRPAEPLHRTPMFAGPELPGTDAFLAGLVEFDTLDLYEPAEELIDGYGRALEGTRRHDPVRGLHGA